MGETGRHLETARLAATAVAVTTGLVLIGLTFVPGPPLYPSWLVAVPLVALFPLGGWVLVERAVRRVGRTAPSSGRAGGPSNDEYNRGGPRTSTR